MGEIKRRRVAHDEHPKKKPHRTEKEDSPVSEPESSKEEEDKPAEEAEEETPKTFKELVCSPAPKRKYTKNIQANLPLVGNR